jgi:hypothetical protein
VISHPLHIPCHVREHILCQENTFFEGSVISHSLLLQYHGCFLKNLRQRRQAWGGEGRRGDAEEEGEEEEEEEEEESLFLLPLSGRAALVD